ncbi:ATP-binding cassette, subfamily B [Aliiroseovarius halocynthiae]|uniref:ABC transporter ATP-binding protein n=1 Tax=Aliiroseovarius halocynthiae TaxID=985055 RepID=A0A545SLB2_9RHOB|nr:ABC transporter ATP-binding protein [Aliiroseovarius halocynthiae]TQV65765.1 ABC transporter ATP-binding protein [Aliiroseovarius halocynthiae]SMR83531.1 ATP-binding cassette, subfamily B [Aliiroseovarius halocynthiae]
MKTHTDAPDAETAPQSGKVDFLASLKLVTGALHTQRGRILVSIGLATLSVLLEVLPIWVIYKLILMITSGQATQSAFWLHVGLMAVTIPVGYLCFGLATRLSHVTAFNLLYGLRMRLARHLAKLPIGYFSNMRSGRAKQTMISEPEKLELLIAHAIPEGISALVSWVIVTIWLFAVDWRMALASVILTPVSLGIMSLAIRISYREASAMQDANVKMNESMVEFLAGMPVIKIFGHTHLERQDTAKAVTRLADVQSEMGRAFVPLGGTFYALILANITVILTVGVWLLYICQIGLGTLLFFVILGANYSTPLMRLFDLFHHFAHISLSATSAREVLDQLPQHDSQQHLPITTHDIVFESVNFDYGGGEVLNDVSFSASAGTVTALVGPSGSGKTTLATLIPRFYDVTGGRITLGGQDVRDMALDQLMDCVGFVFQDPFLFTATISENIRYGRPDATDDEVQDAARAACAHDFIMALPDGYDTVIGQGAQLLSGGERQRISIARAMIKDAPVVILDEATAFTDPDSEAEIQQAIKVLTRDKTLIAIAHRLHTITEADQILVLDCGRITERGRHTGLLAKGGQYARLWQDYTLSQSTPLRQKEDLP